MAMDKQDPPTDPRDTKHMPGDKHQAGEPMKRAGFVAQGFKGDVHADVLRRVNREPKAADGKSNTVSTNGNVITVNMPNGSQYRLTLGERQVEKAPTKDEQKELPKNALIPETVTPEDVKAWEYSPPPAAPGPEKTPERR